MHANNLSKALNDLRKENQLCDIVIKVGGRAFNAHKVVLAACSSYFMAMFTSGFKESTESEINIEGKADIFEILLEYSYTGSLKIQQDNAYDVLEMACYMQLTDASADCSSNIMSRFMTSSLRSYYYSSSTPTQKMSMGDALKISELARCHDHLKQLAVAATKFLCDNLPELKKCDVFLQSATEVFLKWFLRLQDLPSTHSEKDVLEMVVCWLKHDWENRRPHAHLLFQHVRLGLVPEEKLLELVDDEIRKVQECNKLIDLVLKEQKSAHSEAHRARKMPNLFATRSTITAPVQFVPDEDIGTDDCRLEYYSSQTKEWKQLQMSCTLNRLASVINIQGKLYAIGGLSEEWDFEEPGWSSDSDSSRGYWDDDDRERERELLGSKSRNQFSVYSTKDPHHWKNLPSIPSARHSMLLVHLRGFIYAIAGLDKDDNALRHVERFDFAQKKWETLAALPKGFKWVSAVAFKDRVLVYGVSEPASKDLASTSRSSRKHVILVYNASNDLWQTKLSEQGAETAKSPALFVYKDQCYRILYQVHKDPPSEKLSNTHRGSLIKYLPLVSRLEMHTRRNAVSLSIGEAVKQELIPGNYLGAFRIEQRVFLNKGGFVFKTHLKIEESQSTNVSLDAWRFFLRNAGMDRRCTNLTSYTFDWKRPRYSTGFSLMPGGFS